MIYAIAIIGALLFVPLMVILFVGDLIELPKPSLSNLCETLK
ncbi:hypothetical protein LAUMK22_04994 [Mycobacterium kansasii]|nr:hypothetical protein LAUMK22_04994 [Mycobacterium kansasii]